MAKHLRSPKRQRTRRPEEQRQGISLATVRFGFERFYAYFAIRLSSQPRMAHTSQSVIGKSVYDFNYDSLRNPELGQESDSWQNHLPQAAGFRSFGSRYRDQSIDKHQAYEKRRSTSG